MHAWLIIFYNLIRWLYITWLSHLTAGWSTWLLLFGNANDFSGHVPTTQLPQCGDNAALIRFGDLYVLHDKRSMPEKWENLRCVLWLGVWTNKGESFPLLSSRINILKSIFSSPLGLSAQPDHHLPADGTVFCARSAAHYTNKLPELFA